MPNIRPVSDLRNYAEVLKEISFEEPVFLTIMYYDMKLLNKTNIHIIHIIFA